MRRLTFALLVVVSGCSGSTATPLPTSASAGFTLPGPWILQAVAADSCAGLSPDARSRSYNVTIYQTGYDTISMNASINGLVTPIMNASYSGLKIQDRLRLVDNSAARLVIDGTFTGTVSSARIAGTLDGTFTSATAECSATNHTVTFTR
jgi:hypothetical protein